MMTLSGKSYSTRISLGSTRTGFTVSWATLDSSGSVINDWSTTGVVELGDGFYGLVTTLSNTSIKFIKFKAEKLAETTRYLLESVSLIPDFTSDITNLLKVETGRWRIVNNQMIVYDDDETTPLYTFDLKDSDGDPSSENVYERVPA